MSPYKVLSVCYNRELTSTRSMVLEAGGYSVFEASSYKQALVALAAQVFDVMLLDHELNDRDTEGLLATAQKTSRPVPVIVLSSRSSNTIHRGANVVDSHQPRMLLDTVGKLVGPKTPAHHS